MSETNFNQGEYTYKEDVRQAVFGGYKAFSGLGEQLLSLGEAIEQLRQLFRDIVENTKTDYPESKPYAGLQFVSQEDKDTFGPMSENVSVRFGMSQIHLPISELSHTRIGISIQLDTMMTLARIDEEKRLARLDEEKRLEEQNEYGCCEVSLHDCCETVANHHGESTSAIVNDYKEDLVTTISDDQLNNCRFCDSENLEYPSKRGDYYWATCYDCGATGPIGKSYDEGIKLWNNTPKTVESKPCCELPVCEDDGCEFDEDATLTLMRGILDGMYPQSTTNYNLEVTDCGCRSCDCQ